MVWLNVGGCTQISSCLTEAEAARAREAKKRPAEDRACCMATCFVNEFGAASDGWGFIISDIQGDRS